MAAADGGIMWKLWADQVMGFRGLRGTQVILWVKS